ncbi:MAG: hypothetical protein Kow0074_17940 [Candidatus Zixiibacteriota bacterium]
MGSEWEFVEIGDVASVRSGYAFKSKDWAESGIPVVKIANVKDGCLDMSKCSYVSEGIASAASEFNLKDGDILIAMTGYIGDVALVRKSDVPCVLNQRVGRFTITNPTKLHALYLFYLLRSRDTRKTIEGLGYGSAQPNISPKLIHGVSIQLPPLKEQHAITCILGALDDKIELNRRMNETLEAMARAIFKSWFVDFDPVRAKAAGQQPPGLAPHIADLFPDAFEESELGEIPKGWKIGELGDVADVNWGDTNVTKNSYVEDGFIAYSAKGPDGFLPYHDYDRTGVVLSAIGANSGYTWLALGKWSCIKNTIRFWSTDETLSTEYLFHATHGNHHWPLRGSAQPFISQGDARKVRVLKPTRDLGKLFGEVVRPFHEKVYRSSIENNILATLRDTLLPRLISGELRVPDAERIVGRCV